MQFNKKTIVFFSIFILMNVPELFAQQVVEDYWRLAQAKEEAGDYVGALQQYNNILLVNESDKDALYQRAVVKGKMELYELALEDFNLALSLNPNSSMIYSGRAKAKGFLFDHLGAIEDSNKAIEMDSTNFNAYLIRGVARMTLGDINGSLSDFEKTLSLNIQSAEAYYYAAEIYFQKKDQLKACQFWSKAGELGYPESFSRLKKICY